MKEIIGINWEILRGTSSGCERTEYYEEFTDFIDTLDDIVINVEKFDYLTYE